MKRTNDKTDKQALMEMPPYKRRCENRAPFFNTKYNAISHTLQEQEQKLITLPMEILMHIFWFLAPKDLGALKQTCRWLQSLANDDILWKHIFSKEFDIHNLSNKLAWYFSLSWQWLYRSKKVHLHSRNNIQGEQIGWLIENGIKWEGQWNGMEFTGYGIAYSFEEGDWNEGLICEGIWENNQLNGLGMERWKDGEYVLGTGFQNDELWGFGIHYWPDGTVYQGNYAENLEEGQGCKKYADGTFYIGEFKEGHRHGFGKLIHLENIGQQCYYEGQWQEDLPCDIYLNNNNNQNNQNNNNNIQDILTFDNMPFLQRQHLSCCFASI